MKRRDALKILGVGAGASVLGAGTLNASTTKPKLKETLYKKDAKAKKRLKKRPFYQK